MPTGPWNKKTHAHMKARQRQNLARCGDNQNENWMRDKLKATGRKWTRQAQWRWRLYDFWCAALGIAVEVDGLEHNVARDTLRDADDMKVSGILVIRVKNRDEADAAAALETIAASGSWNERRKRLGLRPVVGGD